MGNHRFKLSDMMPNAWFYKLRDMSKVRSHKNMQSNSRKFSDSRFPHEPPTKSTNKRANRKTVYTPSDPVSLSGFQYDIRDESYFSDIIIDVHEFHQPQLPPIQTKPGKHVLHNTSINFPPTRSRRTSTSPASRKSFSAGVKIRPYAGKKPEGRRRRNVEEDKKKGMFYSDSFAIVKASFDPEKDFKESMMEMIVENNIREAKDLEDLLACFLSLNSNQYHDLIIKAFEQIWFSMARLQS